MSKYEVRVNGKKVWESEQESVAVDRVSIMTFKGEAAVIGSSPDDTWVDILVNERPVGLETFLDMVEADVAKARQAAHEIETTGPVVKADPETGLPVEDEASADEETAMSSPPPPLVDIMSTPVTDVNPPTVTAPVS